MLSLIVKDYGVSLRYRKGLIIVCKKGEVVEKIPLVKVDEIWLLTSGITISTRLIRVLAKTGKQLYIMSHTGNIIARLETPICTKTVLTRRKQYEAYLTEKGIHLAKSFAIGKIVNQAKLLKYLAKYFKNASRILRDLAYQVESRAYLLKNINFTDINKARIHIIKIEAEAARIYWQAVAEILPAELGFEGRRQEGEDIFNKMLNYGYGVLKGYIWRSLLLVGLDPYAGFLHTDKSGKTSLIFDFIEEFRQPIVDYTLIKLAVKEGSKLLKYMEGTKLNIELRVRIVEAVKKRLEEKTIYENDKITFHTVIMRQARKIAKYLRGEIPEYKPFTWVI